MPRAPSHAHAEGFVRPRFDDGSFDEPLLLEDHFVDRFLGPHRTPTQLLLVGARGAGLTTTLRWLASLCHDPAQDLGATRPRVPIAVADLCFDPTAALQLLASGEGLLLLDLSITPLTPGNWRVTQALMTAGLPSHRGSRETLRGADMVIVSSESLDHGEELGQGCSWAQDLPHLQRAQLAPWTSDDLLELLGSTEELRARRAALFGTLQSIRNGPQVLARPRTALHLVKAALQLGEEEPITLARLYANILDTLSPWSIEVLRRMRHDELRLPLLRDALLERIDDPAEVTTLFEFSAGMATTIDALSRLEGGALAEAAHAALERPMRVSNIPLSLPGLHDFLQAGGCLEEVARGEVPAAVSPRWFPFLRELATPAHRRTLAHWLTAEGEAHKGDASAATLLLGLGETPQLDARKLTRHLQLSGAFLPKLDLPGAHLSKANLYDAVLSGARLEGAFLGMVELSASTCIGTSFDGAYMTKARFGRAQMHHASLRGATINYGDFVGTSLPTADLEGAHLLRALFDGADLTRANLARAQLESAVVRDCQMRGTNLRGANLRKALLERLDLTQAQFDADTELTLTTFQSCGLSELGFDGALDRAQFIDCDLSDAAFRATDMGSARFRACRMHNVAFDGADLRGAVFEGVVFHAGSSRAGMLQGGSPMEGSMSGYYAEGTSDDAWASAESIRQASFRGANLADAVFTGTDLFRVDFRDAIISEELRDLARQGGAILDR